jgi:hypothetical protein
MGIAGNPIMHAQGGLTMRIGLSSAPFVACALLSAFCDAWAAAPPTPTYDALFREALTNVQQAGRLSEYIPDSAPKDSPQVRKLLDNQKDLRRLLPSLQAILKNRRLPLTVREDACGLVAGSLLHLGQYKEALSLCQEQPANVP